jgi:archaellum component FlaC
MGKIFSSLKEPKEIQQIAYKGIERIEKTLDKTTAGIDNGVEELNHQLENYILEYGSISRKFQADALVANNQEERDDLLKSFKTQYHAHRNSSLAQNIISNLRKASKDFNTVHNQVLESLAKSGVTESFVNKLLSKIEIIGESVNPNIDNLGDILDSFEEVSEPYGT